MQEPQSHNEAALLQNLATEGLHSNNLFRLSVRIGRFLVHRGPSEWLLEHTPEPLRDSVRSLVAKGFRRAGDRFVVDDRSLRQDMNGKLFFSGTDTENGTPTLDETDTRTLSRLFPIGREQEWPRQLVFGTRDILPDPLFMSKRMHHFPKLVGTLLGQDIPVAEDLSTSAAGKTVVVSAYHSGGTILHNGADVVERNLVLRKKPYSLEGITPAAVLLGKSILELMALRQQEGVTLLRPDSESLLRHITLHGYSQGGNITTDAFRYIRHELKSGRYALALDTQGTQASPVDDDRMIGRLLSGAYIFNIAGVDQPYTAAELGVLPPRDNVRSDGDMVISAAAGLSKQQSNYDYRWRQDEPAPQRHDRLLETIGPVGRYGRQGNPDDPSYFSHLGHNEKHYWNHALPEAADALTERLAARFAGRTVASDITFSGDTLRLTFERGTPPQEAGARRRQFLDALGPESRIVPLAPAAASPYDVTLSVPPEPQSLQAIGNALRQSGIGMSREVAESLNPQHSLQLLSPLAKRVPGMQMTVGYGGSGPYISLTREGGLGGQVAKMLQKDLKALRLPGRHPVQPDGVSLDLPVEDTLAALRSVQKQQLKSAVRQR